MLMIFYTKITMTTKCLAISTYLAPLHMFVEIGLDIR